MPSPHARLFDTHAHFFTNDRAQYPVDLTGAREGAEALDKRIERDPSTAARVLSLWDACNVTGGAAVQYNSVYKTDNSYTIHVADVHHNRASAVLMMNAQAPETPGKLAALSARHNISALRLFGYPDEAGEYPWLDSAAALATWDVAAAHGLHMVLMYAPGRPSHAALRRIIALARRYPKTTIALDHCGWPGLGGGLDGTIGAEHRELADVGNILFKFTQINLNQFAQAGIDGASFVRRLVDTHGADRVMWGSDYGNTQDSFAKMVDDAVAATARLSDAERAKVLHDNGSRMFADRWRT